MNFQLPNRRIWTLFAESYSLNIFESTEQMNPEEWKLGELLLACFQFPDSADLWLHSNVRLKSKNSPVILFFLKWLLVNGANPNTPTQPSLKTPLILCQSWKDSFTVTELLLSHGADLHQCDQLGYSPLHHACANGNFETISLLLRNGAQVNAVSHVSSQKTTPLHETCQNCSENDVLLKILRLLIAHKADIHAKTYLGWTVLNYLVPRGNVEAVEIFLENGSGNELLKNHTMTELAFLTQALYSNNVEMVRLLLQNGADVECPNFHRESALYIACLYNRSPEIIECLLTHGANPNFERYDQLTPLYAAVCGNSYYSLCLLIAHGADLPRYVNVEVDESVNMLMVAIRNKSACIAEKLLAHGARWDFVGAKGATPLLEACMQGNMLPVVRLLLEAGANPDSLAYQNITPLMIAQYYNDTLLMSLLTEFGAGRRIELKPLSRVNMISIQLLVWGKRSDLAAETCNEVA